MYIYKFTHIESGRVYIGQTIQNPNNRRLEHLSSHRRQIKNSHFYNALNKYGFDAFVFEVIDSSATSKEELDLLEIKYIQEYDSVNNGFNVTSGGNNALHSEDTKKKQSEIHKERHKKLRESGAGYGWKRQDGGSMKGKQCSEASNTKRRETHLLNNYYKGKTWRLVDGKRVWMDKE